MKTTKPFLPLLLLCLAFPAAIQAADGPTVIDLWPATAPGMITASGPEDDSAVAVGSVLPKQIKNVSHPTLTLFQPEAGKANGVAVIVAPGGGFRDLESDKEGEKGARWLNTIGVTAFVLKYRIPADPNRAQFAVSLPDAQRAVSLVRSRAANWAIRSDRIGMMGFSAGAQLAVAAGTHFTERAYPASDAADSVSCRPDFGMIIYPGGLLSKGTEELSPDFAVTKTTPPMFIVDAETDRVDSENCTSLFVALKRAGVPAELHIYTLGEHGFAFTPNPRPYATWPQRCYDWMIGQGILEPK
jgi:acetyl esterase/lipase